MNLIPIGYVKNDASEFDLPGQIKQRISTIELYDPYLKGLNGIAKHDYIVVVFGLHKTAEIHLEENTLSGERCGIFACRSQHRPNHLGITTCRLTDVLENGIRVTGLDACDDSPVYDLKCPDTSEDEQRLIHDLVLMKNPRQDIEYDIRNNIGLPLLLKAGELTGTLTPELAVGVMIGLDFMRKLRRVKKNAVNFTLTTPVISPVLDGVLFVTGITPGSGRLKYETGIDKTIQFTNPESGEKVIYTLKEQPFKEDPLTIPERDTTNYFDSETFLV
ncbi:MAG: TrmO family methyltransferase [Bacteroidales bacterium]